jgi:hypothetical protein
MNHNWASTLSFASMIAWHDSIHVFFKVIGEYLCCLAWDSNNKRWVMLPPFGYYEMEKLEQCIQIWQDIMNRMDYPVIFSDVSAWMLPYLLELKPVKLQAVYDPTLSDYIYKAEDFREALHSSSNLYDYNYFIRKYTPQISHLESKDADRCVEFMKEMWCSHHECNYCRYGCLLDSARSIIETIKDLDAKGIAVTANQELLGYAVISIEKDQLIFHFKEHLHSYRGLGVYINRKCFELFGNCATIVNYTEDMGFEGLRLYKQRLSNYELSHKYELRIG